MIKVFVNNLVKGFWRKFTQRKTLSNVSGFHDQSVLKFYQCFYLKLPLGSKFKDKQNDSKKMFDWSIPIKVHRSFQKNRMGFLFRQIRQSQSTFFDKVFDAGLHDQKTLWKETLTKFLMENFDRVNGPIVEWYGQQVIRIRWIILSSGLIPCVRRKCCQIFIFAVLYFEKNKR